MWIPNAVISTRPRSVRAWPTPASTRTTPPTASFSDGLPVLLPYADNLNVVGTCRMAMQRAKGGQWPAYGPSVFLCVKRPTPRRRRRVRGISSMEKR
eukprot:7020873-Lingulodinium_polyedra.AAC.1